MKDNLIRNKRIVALLLGCLVTLVLFIITFFALSSSGQAPLISVNNYNDCVKAGGVIMESYPQQCRTSGRTFTQDLDEDQKDNINPPQTEFYGSSTEASCGQDSDCVISGCNAEICKGKDEDAGVSICIAPDQPLPQTLGYSCGCVANKCQWKK